MQADLVNAASSGAPTFIAQPSDPRLAHWLKGYPPSVFSEPLYQSIELMERYSIDLAIDLLSRLDVTDQLGEWRSANELCHVLSFRPGFSFALAWILERLVETGCVEASANGNTRSYHLRRSPWQPELERLRAVGLSIDPANAASLDLLDHAASLYPAVASGEQSGDHSLFGPQGIPLWLKYFHNDNLTYAVNNWVSAILAADRLSAQPRLRILELGAGAGSASETLLRWFDQCGLLPQIERYVITEPNAFFRRRAQRDLTKQYPDLPLEWAALDLNLPWDTQGVDRGEFVLVYAVNVLHVSKNLLFSLNQARSALNGDGWLVIGECLRPYVNQPIYPELMFQILESFTEVQIHAEIGPDIDSIRQIYPHFFTGAICGQKRGHHK